KDGSELIASSENPFNDEEGLITFWDTNSGLLKPEKNISLSDISFDIALSPDGSMLATGNFITEPNHQNGSVTLWNLSTNTIIKTFSGHSGYIRTLGFSPDNNLLVVASVEFDCSDNCSTITIWDLSSSQKLPSSPLTGLPGNVPSVGFSPQNNIFVASSDASSVSSDQKNLHFWKIPVNISEPWIPFHILKESLPPGAGASNNFFAISPTENVLAFVWSQAEPIHILNIGVDKIPHEEGISFTSPVSSLEFNSLGTTLISSDVQANLKLWNTTNKAELIEYNGSTSTILGSSIALSPDNNWIVSGNGDNTIRFYNYTNGQFQFSLKSFDSNVFSIAFSSDGKWLASGHSNGGITLWNTTDFTNITIHNNFTNHISGITALAFSPDNSLLASGSIFSTILLWNISSNNIISPLIGHKERVTSLEFSPNGLTLASGSWDKLLIIWNVPDGTINTTLLHPSEINSIAYAFDGDVILSGNSDGIIRLWEISSEFLISNLRGHIGEVLALDFSSNRILASGGADGNIFLWELTSLPTDSDGDGMNDNWEDANGLNRFYYFDSFSDPDKDGLMNGLEYKLQSNPKRVDSDNDSISDLWEYLYHSNPVVVDNSSDTDRDFIPNWYEYQFSLNGLLNDSAIDKDGDGITNYQEFLFKSDSNSSDTDKDGMPDLYELQMSEKKGCPPVVDPECRYTDPLIWSWKFVGLDPQYDDSQLDLDEDGLPNLWEYLFNLNASDSKDGGYLINGFNDLDDDGMSNLFEYQYGF
ncbi:MAG: WD40 repeat domain-containing protein, partial [Candidatus Kariarchaeaceae archaeon]